MDKRKNTKGQTMIYKQYNGQKKKDQGTNNDLQTEGQTIQWTKEKRPRDKQRSTKHTHKTKDRVTRTPLKSDIRILIAPLVSSKLFLANRNCSFDIYQ